MALGCVLLVFIALSQMAAWANPIDEKIVKPNFSTVIEVSPQSPTRIRTHQKFRKSYAVVRYDATTDPEYYIEVNCRLSFYCDELSLALFLGDQYDVREFVCSKQFPYAVRYTFTPASSKLYLLFSSGTDPYAEYDCTFKAVKSVIKPSTTAATTTAATTEAATTTAATTTAETTTAETTTAATTTAATTTAATTTAATTTTATTTTATTTVKTTTAATTTAATTTTATTTVKTTTTAATTVKTTTTATTTVKTTTSATTTAPSSLLTRKPDYQKAYTFKEGDRLNIKTTEGFSAERYLAQYDLSTGADDLGLTVDCTLRLNCADIGLALFVSPLPKVSRYDCNLDKEPVTVSASSFGRSMTLFFHSGYSTSGQYDCLVKTRKIDPHETTTTTKTTTTTTTSKPYGCQCGESSVNKIINGSPVQLGEIPWQVGIQSETDGIWKTFCGGSLVSDRFVVTALHCIKDLTVGQIQVQMGVIRRDETGVIGTVRSIIKPTIYSSVAYDSDIAILKLNSVVDFNKNIFPICVPPRASKETFAGRTMTVSGWGSINTNGDKSPVLLKTEVVGMTDEECIKIYGSEELTSNMMCARKQGTDACQGDSGGPLTYKDKNGISFLTGIVSWGDGCAQKPGVYVRMTETMAWFNSQTEDSVCTKTWRL